ncbi:hypothetical protein [Armatimonas sp.]|uniref:hypothetical protein n=1 Tax=Armatimonas sp. TaxID=1872638 RepID=UPI00286A327A|nr:hypothetical protein [Armatimonas sp.]
MVLTRRTLLLASFGGQLAPPQNTPRWNAERNGPLLIVAPEKLTEPSERQLFRMGRVNVMAPTEAEEIIVPTEPPSAVGIMSRGDRFHFLLAKLSDEHWGQLTGKRGLGPSDLAPELRPILTELLKTKRNAPTDRLRLCRTLEIHVPTKSSEEEPDSNATPAHLVVNPYGSTYDIEGEPELGILRTPNRLKRSTLDYSSLALQRTIVLENLKTVAELLQQVATATRLSLRADPRLGTLTLWHSPGRHTVLASELLKALALGVTGTFRKVGGTFLLTHDLEPQSVRLARRQLWWLSSQELLIAEQEKEKKRLAGKGKELAFTKDTDLGLPQETLERLLSSGNQENQFGWSVLPPTVLQSVEKELSDSETIPWRNLPLELNPALVLMAVGSGGKHTPLYTLSSIGSDAISDLSQTLAPDTEPDTEEDKPPAIQAPAAWPESINTRVLLATARTADEGKALAALARHFGFIQLGLSGPDEALSAAASTIPVALAFSPFVTDEPTRAARTILGETTRQALARLKPTIFGKGGRFAYTLEHGLLDPAGKDWALPTRPLLPTLPPGINEILVLDTEPPARVEYGGNTTLYGRIGFTAEARLAFLAQHSTDPLDLALINPEDIGIQRGDSNELPLRWLPRARELESTWEAESKPPYEQALQALRKEAKAARIHFNVVFGDFHQRLGERDFWRSNLPTLYLDARLLSLEELEKRLRRSLLPNQSL